MGREVRLVAENWKHPLDENGRKIPMYEGSELETDKLSALENYEYEKENFVPVKNPYYEEDFTNFEDYCAYQGISEEFDESRYMPNWTDAEKTHIMLYENVSEGTSMSPAFLSSEPEKLAQWLADNNANAGAYATATYEQWLCMVKKGYAVSGVMVAGSNTIISGVEASCSM